MSCTLWGAVDGLDWAGWAGRHQSWLPATSLISRSMSCCKWHQFDLALSTVELLAIFSHTSNQAPEGKVLMWPGYTTGFLKITPWLIIHHWSSGPKLLHNFMCAMGSLSQRSHKAGWVVRRKKKKKFLPVPLKFCLAFLQAPPRTLRPRFRKKSTSSSATETMWVQWANSTKIHRMSLFCLKELLVHNVGNSSGMDVLWCTAL